MVLETELGSSGLLDKPFIDQTELSSQPSKTLFLKLRYKLNTRMATCITRCQLCSTGYREKQMCFLPKGQHPRLPLAETLSRVAKEFLPPNVQGPRYNDVIQAHNV